MKIKIKMEVDLPDEHYLSSRKKIVGKEDVYHIFVYGMGCLEEAIKKNESKLLDLKSELVTNKCTGKCHVKEEEIVPVNSVEQAKFDRLKLQIDCLENTIKWQWDNLAALSGLLKNINIKII